MTSTPPEPASDEADPEKQTTPAGVVRDLEEKAEETGGSTEPSPPTAQRVRDETAGPEGK
jgi:hypothetical protein